MVDSLLLTENPPDNETLITRLMNGVLLFANANQELNFRRRELLRPQLNANYRYLCAPSNPVTGELFGDDLPKAIKDITDTNRLSSKLTRDSSRYTRRGTQQHTYTAAGRGKYKNYYNSGSRRYIKMQLQARQKTTAAPSGTSRRRGARTSQCATDAGQFALCLPFSW